jgi:hypothetical protein
VGGARIQYRTAGADVIKLTSVDLYDHIRGDNSEKIKPEIP